MERYKVAETLAKFTQEGPVCNWTQRIADIAGKIGIDLSYINWNQPPYYVAVDVAHACENAGKLDALKAAIA